MTRINIKRVKVKKKQKRLTLVLKADSLWRSILKTGYCEKCGNRGWLEPHHIITRSNKTLCWDLRNRIWLCGGKCHKWQQNHPKDFLAWFQQFKPEDHAYLMKRKIVIWDGDIDKVLECLEEVGSG